MTNSNNQYESFADNYERVFSQEGRYRAEVPFFRRFISENRLRTILDIPCGNGFHLKMFDSIPGVTQIVGADASTKMVQKSRQTIDSNETPTKVIHSTFAKLGINIDRTFDLITCIHGLAENQQREDLVTTLKTFYRLLKPKGFLILENTNGDWILKHNPTFEHHKMESPFFTLINKPSLKVTVYHQQSPIIRTYRHQNQWFVEIAFPLLYRWLKSHNLYLKVYHHTKELDIHDHIFIHSGVSRWRRIDHHRVTLHLLTRTRLTQYLKQAGFHQLQFFSGHQNEPYSHDTIKQIVIARKN